MKLSIVVLFIILLFACSFPTYNQSLNSSLYSCEPFYYRLDNNLFSVIASKKYKGLTIQAIIWPSLIAIKANSILLDVVNNYIYSCPGKLSLEDVDNTFFDAIKFHGVNSLPSFKYWLAIRSIGNYR